jgi:hypothetical protein
MVRIYTNENFPLPAAIELSQRGHDVLERQFDLTAQLVRINRPG